MYGNVGDKYIQTKEINRDGFKLNNIGTEYIIQDYYSVPHGYASIENNGILIFIPDKLFNECFVKEDIYNKYIKQGDNLRVNVNGEFRTYEVVSIEQNGSGTHYVSLELEAVD